MGPLRDLLPLCPVAFLKRFLEYAEGLFYYHVYLISIWYHICPAMVLYLALCLCYTHPTPLGIAGLLSHAIRCYSGRACPCLYIRVGRAWVREYSCHLQQPRLPYHLSSTFALLAALRL